MKRILLLIFMACVLASSAYAATDDAIAYISFNNVSFSGNEIADLSGNGYTAYNHGTTYVQGKLGDARSFDGSNDWINLEYINGTGNSGLIGHQSAFAISYWLKDAQQSLSYIADWCHGSADGCTSDNVHNLLLERDVTGTKYSYLGVDSKADWSNQGGGFSSSAWTHVVVTYDGNSIYTWVDGSNIGSDATYTGDTRSGQETNLSIGREQVNGGSYNYQTLLIDEIAIYRHNLTASDVATLYNNGSGYDPYSGPPPAPESGNFTIFAIDNKTGNNITIFSAVVDNVTYNTTTSWIVTDVLHNDTGAHNITIYRITGDYQNITTLNYNVSTNLTASLKPYWQVTLSDQWDNSAINGFNATINGTLHTTTTDTLITDITFDSSNSTAVLEASEYFPKTFLDQSPYGDTAYELFQAQIDLSATEIITGNTLTGLFWTGSNSTTSTFYIKAGNYNITFQNSSYFNRTQQFTVSALSNGSQTIQNVYSSILNITAVSLVDGSSISNFTINISSESLTYNATHNTTDGNVTIYLLNATYYNLTIDAPGFEIPNSSTEIYVTSSPFSHQFNLYTTNSINFTFLDEETGTVVYNVSVELISDVASYNDTAVNGTLYMDLISPSTYAIRYVAAGYSERFYYFNLQNRSHTDLTLYLLSNTTATEVTAIVYDEGNNFVEDATIKVLKYDLTTNSYIVMEVVQTNFEGEAKLNLVLNTEFYKFMIEYPLGTLKEETSPTYIYGTTLNFQINLGADVAEDFYNSNDITYSLVFNNATNNFRFTYSDANNIVSQGCLDVYWIRASGSTLINSTCTSSASATILSLVENVSGRTYEAEGYVFFGSNRYNLIELLHSFDETSSAGQFGIFLIAMLTVLLAFTSMWSRSVALIVTPLPLFLGSIINIIDFSMGTALSIEIVCIIIAVWLSRRN